MAYLGLSSISSRSRRDRLCLKIGKKPVELLGRTMSGLVVKHDMNVRVPSVFADGLGQTKFGIGEKDL